MSTHTIQTEIEIDLPYGDTAHPLLEITFDYERGYVPKTPPGEYGPIDPPVGAELSFREAKLINSDGTVEQHAKVQKWAEDWLDSDDGYDYACDCAELDLAAQKHAHLENSRDQ